MRRRMSEFNGEHSARSKYLLTGFVLDAGRNVSEVEVRAMEEDNMRESKSSVSE